MVRLNHKTIVDNKPVTPFLIDGSQVYCFDKYKETIILPLDSFKAKKAKRATVIPMPVFSQVKEAAPVPTPRPIPEEPVEEKIIIKPKMIHTMLSGGSIRAIGSASYRYKVTPIVKPVVETKTVYRYKPNGFTEVLGAAETRFVGFKPYVKEYEGAGLTQAIGAANAKVVIKVADTPPPVVDNSRYIRPTLDDGYI
jgi:hypothetical protein